MPRVNPLRSLANERNLARRIAYERSAARMSLDGLAHRMTDLGLPMQKTTIHKIEQGKRRITVDELIGFAKVFKLDIGEMTIPVSDKLRGDAWKLFETWIAERNAEASAREAAAAVEDQLATYLEANPDAIEAMGDVLRWWAESHPDYNARDPEEVSAYFLLKFRRASRDEMRAHHERYGT